MPALPLGFYIVAYFACTCSMVVPAGKLKSVLEITEVQSIAKHSHLAIVDASLEDATT